MTDTTSAPGAARSALGVDEADPRERVAAEETGDQATLWSDAWRTLRRNPFFLLGAAFFVLFAVMAAFPSLFTNTDPRFVDLALSRDTPSGAHWFGVDVQGADYYANVIYGARVSMIIGLVVVLGSLLIGTVLGAIAGYYGGWLDSLIARFTDVMYGLPYILGALIILQTFEDRQLFHVCLALIALSWMTPLRLVRSSIISVKEADYVLAARALGASTPRIIIRHMLPNAIAPVLVYGTILAGVIIAAEAALSFLGIGLQQPQISWGLQISVAQDWLREAPHLMLFPAGFLILTVLAFILMGDALRDALDPKMR